MATFVLRFLKTAQRREIVGRAIRTALVVGTILAAINHGPEIVALDVDLRRVFRICLTYAVPSCVSTYSAAMQELRPRPPVISEREAAWKAGAPARQAQEKRDSEVWGKG